MGPKERLLIAMQNISLEDLAKKSGVTSNVLSQIKHGKCACSEERAEMLLKIIDQGIEGAYTHIPKAESETIVRLELEIKIHKEAIKDSEHAVGVIRRTLK